MDCLYQPVAESEPAGPGVLYECPLCGHRRRSPHAAEDLHRACPQAAPPGPPHDPFACIHRGEIFGSAPAPSCCGGGETFVPVAHCALLTACSLGESKEPGLPNCTRCPHRTPPAS